MTWIFIVFVHFSVKLILETFALLLILWVLFSCAIWTFVFWNPFIFNWVSIYDFFDVTEVLRIKECSPIPLSYLLNSIHLSICSKSVSSIWTKTSRLYNVVKLYF